MLRTAISSSFTGGLPCRPQTPPTAAQNGSLYRGVGVNGTIGGFVDVYQVVDVVMKVNERSRDTMASHAQLQRAWQIIGRDLMHLRPRTLPMSRGTEPAYITNPSDFGIASAAVAVP